MVQHVQSKREEHLLGDTVHTDRLKNKDKFYNVPRSKLERAIVVGMGRHYHVDEDNDGHDPLKEIISLADTAGAEVVGRVVQMRENPDPAHFIGKGKVSELKEEVERLEAELVIFDNELTPAQGANLENMLGVKVVDRPGIILDIFALRARTREARTQVELAQMKYLLPRLAHRWTHFSKQQGGIGGRGPGETQLETDRRAVRIRINNLTKLIDKIQNRHDVSRNQRNKVFKVALVGYTNAGKSTLLNILSGAGVPVEDKLFKTLDSTTRAVRFDSGAEFIISDTVGFIRDLPHELVASFKSTLDEVRDADLLLNVTDMANPEWEEQAQAVEGVLVELGAAGTEMVMVFNKTDIAGEDMINALRSRYPEAVFVSGGTGEGIDKLKEAVKDSAAKKRMRFTRDFRPEDNVLLREVYRHAEILDTNAVDDVINLTFTLDKKDAERLGLTAE